MKARVRDVLAAIDGFAPFELAESYDNVGLLAGARMSEITRVLVALDLTEGVLEEAESIGAELIVTHHPILFHARKNLCEDDPEGRLLCRLVRSGRALIAAHTNYDNAPDGLNDALAEALSLANVAPLAHGLRCGWLPRAMGAADFELHLQSALGGTPRVRADRSRGVWKIAVCGGAGGEFWPLAAEWGADAYVTGELRHHEALACNAAGLVAAECGHYETEHIAIKALANHLQNALYALQYKVDVWQSARAPFVERL